MKQPYLTFPGQIRRKVATIQNSMLLSAWKTQNLFRHEINAMVSTTLGRCFTFSSPWSAVVSSNVFNALFIRQADLSSSQTFFPNHSHTHSHSHTHTHTHTHTLFFIVTHTHTHTHTHKTSKKTYANIEDPRCRTLARATKMKRSLKIHH